MREWRAWHRLAPRPCRRHRCRCGPKQRPAHWSDENKCEPYSPPPNEQPRVASSLLPHSENAHCPAISNQSLGRQRPPSNTFEPSINKYSAHVARRQQTCSHFHPQSPLLRNSVTFVTGKNRDPPANRLRERI